MSGASHYLGPYFKPSTAAAHHFFFPLQVVWKPLHVEHCTVEVSPLAVVIVSVAPWKLGVDRPGVTRTDVTSDPDVSSASGTAGLEFIAWAAHLQLRVAHARHLPDSRPPYDLAYQHHSITGCIILFHSVMRPCAVP